MTVKFLQLNIWKGRYLPEVVKFVKRRGFDILHLQEVNGGKKSWRGRDTFKKLRRSLPHRGIVAVANHVKRDVSSYSAVATFIRNDLKIGGSQIIRLKRFAEVIPKKTRIQDYPRCALAQEIFIGGKRVMFINAHLAWGPKSVDKKYKLMQARRLLKYLKSLRQPFILSGDFNLDPSSKIVQSFGRLATNLTIKHKIKNTLNPRMHYAKHLFPPGLAVDYIFVSKGIKVKKFRVVDRPNLSDHFGLAAEFEV